VPKCPQGPAKERVQTSRRMRSLRVGTDLELDILGETWVPRGYVCYLNPSHPAFRYWHFSVFRGSGVSATCSPSLLKSDADARRGCIMRGADAHCCEVRMPTAEPSLIRASLAIARRDLHQSRMNNCRNPEMAREDIRCLDLVRDRMSAGQPETIMEV
jgi:hypothetical protein